MRRFCPALFWDIGWHELGWGEELEQLSIEQTQRRRNTGVREGDRESAEHEVPRLKQQPGKDLFLFGSANLANALTRSGLIDEYRLGVNPVVLGAGNPLFKPAPERMKMKLLEARALKSDCVLLRYEPVRWGAVVTRRSERLSLSRDSWTASSASA